MDRVTWGSHLCSQERGPEQQTDQVHRPARDDQTERQLHRQVQRVGVQPRSGEPQAQHQQ